MKIIDNLRDGYEILKEKRVLKQIEQLRLVKDIKND